MGTRNLRGAEWRGLAAGALIASGLGLVTACGDDDDGASDATGGKGGSSTGGRSGSSGEGGSSGTATGGSSGSSGSSGSAGQGGSSGKGGTSGGGGTDAGAGGEETGGGGGAPGGSGGEGGSVATCDVTPPASYDTTTFAANTTVEVALAARLTALTGSGSVMRRAEVAPESTGVMPATRTEMEVAFESGSPSLAATADDSFSLLATRMFREHADAAQASWLGGGPAVLWDPATAPAGEGGLLVTGTNYRIYNERGIELRQVVEKGAFTGVFLNHALALLDGTITRATVDRLAHAFGVVDPAMPIPIPMPAPATAPYTRMASYAYQVGILLPIRVALTAAQAYAGDPDCTAERDQALAALLLGWERTAMARTVHYAAQTITHASAMTPNVDGALHALAEGHGLVHGFRGIPASSRRITDAELGELVGLILFPSLDEATPYELQNENGIDSLQTVITRIQAIYGFSNADIANFRLASPNVCHSHTGGVCP